MSPIPIIACAMVGARQGWKEVPYNSAPTSVNLSSIKIPTQDLRIAVYIIAGLCQQNPANVMRGEETQIAGFLADRPKFTGSLCLPGTHCKWVKIDGRKIHHFQTSMTGEINSLLSKQSVLKHSMGEWQQEAFLASVTEAYFNPEKVITRLFEICGGDLINDDHFGQARLSGLLIGAELVGVKRYWYRNETIVVGADKLAQHYAEAINSIGGSAKVQDVGDLTLKGLTQVYREIYQCNET